MGHLYNSSNNIVDLFCDNSVSQNEVTFSLKVLKIEFVFQL